jgi:hypothetical protein
MANLVKIKEVYLYIGLTAKTSDCDAAKKLLDDANVKYNLLTYNDPAQHHYVFESLSTWNWGNPNNLTKRTFTDFPILHWKEYYDDYEQQVECADGLTEIENCSLLKNASLVEA